jgi:hypothetical protein
MQHTPARDIIYPDKVTFTLPSQRRRTVFDRYRNASSTDPTPHTILDPYRFTH